MMIKRMGKNHDQNNLLGRVLDLDQEIDVVQSDLDLVQVLGHRHPAEVERVEGTAREINLSPDRPLVAPLQDQGLDAHAVGQGRVTLLRDQDRTNERSIRVKGVKIRRNHREDIDQEVRALQAQAVLGLIHLGPGPDHDTVAVRDIGQGLKTKIFKKLIVVHLVAQVLQVVQMFLMIICKLSSAPNVNPFSYK